MHQFRYPDCFAFLSRGFIERQSVPVNPVCGVFFAEIRGNDDRLYALDAAGNLRYLAVNTHSGNTAPLASRITICCG